VPRKEDIPRRTGFPGVRVSVQEAVRSVLHEIIVRTVRLRATPANP
jgi:hypothetical protein